MTWTDERTELLKQLWNEGLSASQIAHKIEGVTRNAIIGKIHRLGMPARKVPFAASHAQNKTDSKANKSGTLLHNVKADSRLSDRSKSPEPELIPLLTPEQRTSVLHLTERTCKWPIGEPNSNDFYFCGVEAKTDLPYCETHAKIAYQPLERKRKRASKIKHIASLKH